MNRSDHAETDQPSLWTTYRMRWKRRRLLFRAVRKRRQLRVLVDRTGEIGRNDILLASTMRNEMVRLPFFLEHHRKLGIGHFLIVDNDSDDGSAEYLAAQPDVSVWRTSHSYRLARFGMDWLTWLLIRHGKGHWCLTLDADEVFIYPHWNERPLKALTDWLDSTGARSMGALMLEMYPRGPVGAQPYSAGQDPAEVLCWFDTGNYVHKYQPELGNLLIRGGVRSRMFFSSEPDRAPTLSKAPLVKWHWRYVYVSSTHSLLPRRLNKVRGAKATDMVSGVILHTKFLNTVVEKSREEKTRKEHFENSDLYGAYYDRLIEDPDFWTPESCAYEGWEQLEALGLMSRGNWR